MVDNPITRKEKYLAKLTGSYAGNVPDPITRVEKYLYDLCQKGISGLTPEEIENAVNKYLKENPVQPGATTEQAQQIEQNKTDIASLKKETGSLKEDLSNKITKFYASSQGETHLADSDNGKIQDMMLYGRSEQKQYSGKNLLNPTLQTTTQNSVTCTANGDGTYTLNGSNANIPSVFTLGTVYLIKDKKYKMAGCPANPGKAYLQLRTPEPDNVAYKNDYSSGVEFVIPKSGKYIVRIYYDVETYNNLLFKPMLTTDLTATYDDFEPYTGGIPSPNPDYPQEIKSVVNPTVKVCGKNLLKISDETNSKNGETVNWDRGGILNVSGILSAETYYSNSGTQILSKGIYTFSVHGQFRKTESQDNKSYLFVRRKSDDHYMSVIRIGNGESFKTFTLNEDTEVFIGFVDYETAKNHDEVYYIQIEKGSTPTTYEPYHEQTVTLPYTLNAIPVSSGGNVVIDGQQYIADYVDVERGKLVRMVEKKVLNGTEGWKLNERSGNRNGVFYVYVNANIAGALCDKAIYESLTSHYGTFDTWYGQIRFYAHTNEMTLEEWRNFLSSNNHVVYIIRNTPEEIDLTEEELQSFKLLQAYYPTTNISINSEQLDGYTVFNYPISMENGWNYVKQQIGDTREYIYDIDARTQDTDLQAAEAYVNSEYAVALTELEV